MNPDPGNDVSDAARVFLRAALEVLRRDHVVPPATFHPYLEVGRDYYGPDLNDLPEYTELERALTAAFPERFGEDLPLNERDVFQGSYIFSFLEACIAGWSLADSSPDPDGPIVTEFIDFLMSRLVASEYEVVCCRIVSHLTTTDGRPAEIQGITIMPETQGGSVFQREILDIIPGAPTAYNRQRPHPWEPPHSLLVARDRGPDPFDLADNLSSRIEGFMLNMRLLHASTARSLYEIRGETSPVRTLKPQLLIFDTGAAVLSMAINLRRTTRLSTGDEAAFSGLSELVGEVNSSPSGISTSFDIAVDKFVRSFAGGASIDKLVDLATALEAMLSGQDKEDVTLRLGTRAAALLTVDEDSPSTIFDDVKVCYALRSTLVHGGRLKSTDLMKQMRKLSTVPPDTLPGFVLPFAIDRLRDLVRRATLARLCLGSGTVPEWPMSGNPPVDSILVDDASRERWRGSWHSKLDTMGALSAAHRALPAAHMLSPEDR